MQFSIFTGLERPDILQELEQLRFSSWGYLLDKNPALKSRFIISELDYKSQHIACHLDGFLIGCGRLSLHSCKDDIPDKPNFDPYTDDTSFPAAFMSRLIVHSDFRNRGIARRIDQLRISTAEQHDMRSIWVEAKANRIKALEAMGFSKLGTSSDKCIPGNWFILYKKLAHDVSSIKKQGENGP